MSALALRAVTKYFFRGTSNEVRALDRVDLLPPRELGEASAPTGLENAERVRPEPVDRRSEALVAAELFGPHLRVQAVVGLLAVHLGRQARELGGGQRVRTRVVKGKSV